MKFTLLLIGFYLFVSIPSPAQTIGESIPAKITKSEKYLFYLHGGVVTDQGNNAITASMPEWGRYEYLNILDSLKARGFQVISERRFSGIADSVYIKKIAEQVDSLLKRGASPHNIILVGASAGASIAITVSAKLKNDKISFVIMGACWPDTYKGYLGADLYGRFLSIIEASDPHGTCNQVFERKTHISNYKEITLHTGLSHGFIFKGYKEWIDPIIYWFGKKKG